MNIIIISGHPDLNQSVANATILDEISSLLPDAEIRRLDRLYPDGKIDAGVEQATLTGMPKKSHSRKPRQESMQHGW